MLCINILLFYPAGSRRWHAGCIKESVYVYYVLIDLCTYIYDYPWSHIHEPTTLVAKNADKQDVYQNIRKRNILNIPLAFWQENPYLLLILTYLFISLITYSRTYNTEYNHHILSWLFDHLRMQKFTVWKTWGNFYPTILVIIL